MQWLILCIHFAVYSYSRQLPCHSEQNNSTLTVNCTATVITENCTDAYLSQHYPDLYRQEYWPDKPYDVQLLPIQEGWPVDNPKYLLPGFDVNILPPQSVSIQYVKGFQVDYVENESGKRKCIIIQISNTTLTSEHREDKIEFVVKAHRMNGSIEYTFTTWSLPKPPPSEGKTNQVRYGKTAKYGLILSTDSSADWVTTISYFNSSHDRYIRIWFVSAPEKYEFHKYNVALEKILSNEGQPTEHRIIVNNTRISQTEYIFWDVAPGRYRVLVQPYDDEVGTSVNSCKCKTRGACYSCIRTKTAVIVINKSSEDDVADTTEQHTTRTSTSTTPLTDTSGNNLVINQQITSTGNPNVVATVVGFLAFLVVVVIIVVVVFRCRRRSDKTNSPATTNQLNHYMYPTSVTNDISTIFRNGNDNGEDSTDHNNIPIDPQTETPAFYPRFIQPEYEIDKSDCPAFIPPEDSNMDTNSVDLHNGINQINNNYIERINEEWFTYEQGR